MNIPNILENEVRRALERGTRAYPNLTSAVTMKLCANEGPTQVRRHGKVGNGCYREYDKGDEVENPNVPANL